MGTHFSLGTFSIAGSPPFAGIVLDDRMMAVSALQSVCVELGRPLSDAESVFGLLQAWDRNFPVLQAAINELGGRGEQPEVEVETVALDAVKIHAPVLYPRQIFCAGANYRQHVIDLAVAQGHGADDTMSLEERRAEAARVMDERIASGSPYVFTKIPSAITGPFDPVILPADSAQPDWELELAVVIGRAARHVSRTEALSYVAGYTIVNDLTSRDKVYRADMKAIGTDWLASKSSPTFLPMGPYLLPAAFVPDPQRLHLGVSQLSNLIALFILGFAIFHIPAGALAYRIGVKNTLLVGLFLESVGGIACAFAPNFAVLAILRFLTGVGGSFIVGMALSLVTSWFRGRELALAMGISGGAAFTLGEAIALFGWVGLIQAMSWSTALIIGGVIGLAIMVLVWLFLRVPSHEAEQLSAGTFEWKALGRVLGNRDLWLIGLSFFGVYGIGLTTAQLLTTYLGQVYHLSQSTGGLIAAVYVLMAIPGSIIGGFWGDRSNNLRIVFIVPWILMGLVLALFSFLGFSGVLIMVVVAGICQIAGFSAWTAAPGHYRDRVFPEDVATAEGLLLTISGLGGFVIPVIFGIIAAGSGFTPAFIFGGIVSVVFALIGFGAREPKRVSTTAVEPIASLEEAFEPHPHS